MIWPEHRGSSSIIFIVDFLDTLYYDAGADNDGDLMMALTLVLCFNCIRMEHITYGILIYVNINDILILATMMMNTLLGVYCLRKPWE